LDEQKPKSGILPTTNALSGPRIYDHLNILRVVPQPETIKTLMVTFKDLDDTARAVSDIIRSGILPTAMLPFMTYTPILDEAEDLKVLHPVTLIHNALKKGPIKRL